MGDLKFPFPTGDAEELEENGGARESTERFGAEKEGTEDLIVGGLEDLPSDVFERAARTKESFIDAEIDDNQNRRAYAKEQIQDREMLRRMEGVYVPNDPVDYPPEIKREDIDEGEWDKYLRRKLGRALTYSPMPDGRPADHIYTLLYRVLFNQEGDPSISVRDLRTVHYFTELENEKEYLKSFVESDGRGAYEGIYEPGSSRIKTTGDFRRSGERPMSTHTFSPEHQGEAVESIRQLADTKGEKDAERNRAEALDRAKKRLEELESAKYRIERDDWGRVVRVRKYEEEKEE